MMNSLEKKGYINREIDKVDRRKVIVTLTKAGKEVWKETKESADNNLEEFISRLGDEKTKQLIALLNDVSDISVEMKNDI